MNIGVSGKYKVRVLTSDLSVSRETPWSDNIITAIGLNYLLAGSSADPQTVRAVAGSGNTPPALGDTSLVSYLGACNNMISVEVTRNITTSPYSITKTVRMRSNLGGVVGNVSEVGVALGSTASSSSNLISRSLVVDPQGAQTTVTVQSNEYLEVIWAFTIYMAQATGAFNMTIDNVVTPFNYTIKPASMLNTNINDGWAFGRNTPSDILVNAYPQIPVGGTRAYNSQTLGDVTGTPAGTSTTESPTPNISAYTPGSFYRDYSFSIGPDSGNFAIGAFILGLSACASQMSISPSVNKVQGKDFTLNLRLSIANYTP